MNGLREIVRLLAMPALLALAAIAPAQTVTQPTTPPPEHHPWGRFEIGSWKLVRVTTQSLGENGAPASSRVDEIRSTLIAATDTEYTLQVEVTAERDGKRFAIPAQKINRTYAEDLFGAVDVRRLVDAELEIAGRKFACQQWRGEGEIDGVRKSVSLCYAPEQFPFVLRREVVRTPQGAGIPTATVVELVAGNLPLKVLKDVHSAQFVRTTHRHGEGSNLILEAQCDDIPGGVVSHSAEEQDDEARVVRRTTLELLEFGVGVERPEDASPRRRGFFHRKRARRTAN